MESGIIKSASGPHVTKCVLKSVSIAGIAILFKAVHIYSFLAHPWRDSKTRNAVPAFNLLMFH